MDIYLLLLLNNIHNTIHKIALKLICFSSLVYNSCVHPFPLLLATYVWLLRFVCMNADENISKINFGLEYLSYVQLPLTLEV